MKTNEELEILKEKEKREELTKKLDSIFDEEFKRSIKEIHPKISNFEILKSSNIQKSTCFHNINPHFYTVPPNPINDVFLRRNMSYKENNKVIKAFVYGQCLECGKIYYFPTNEFVGFILKKLNLV